MTIPNEDVVSVHVSMRKDYRMVVFRRNVRRSSRISGRKVATT